MKCASVDGVHFNCRDTVKLVTPAPATSSK
jgi:hypothetical protein